MDITLPSGSYEQEFMVTEDTSAAHVGSGTVEVLSTPSMILFMERTARTWAANYLPEGYTTVGTRVCIEHLKAVGVGKTVVARITLVKQDRRRLEFAVEVLDDTAEVIGRGEHTRFIVDEQKFIEKSI